MSKTASERLFDETGQLVAGVGQPIPDGVKTRTAEQVAADVPDPEYPAGVPDYANDPTALPSADAITEVPLHTPAEQALVDAGKMAARSTGGVSKAPAAKK